MFRKLLFSLTLLPSLMWAQDFVDVNLDVKHAVNGVSQFDRSKFIMIHASSTDSEWPSEAIQKQFLEDYDVYLGRDNGSLPWNLTICEQDPAKPGWPSISYLQQKGAQIKSDYLANTNARQYENRRSAYMIGGQEGMFPNQTAEIGPTGKKWFMPKDGFLPLAEYFANEIKYFYGEGGQPKPTFVEVMNEPFVKATRLGTTTTELSEMYKVVGRRIKELNPEVKLAGYSAAHPALESNNFSLWDKNWKTFIDIAGADMDAFSLHLYDNLQGDTASGQYRAGSNIEAILDMIEQYVYLKLGVVKPFAISEYGCLANTSGQPYTKQRDWDNIRSFSTIMMQLMEKQDIVDQALPFLLLKANWWKNDQGFKYPHRLFRQKKELAGETGDEWVYTEVVKFFQLWSNVKGTRVETKPSSIDVQVDTYVNGNKAYVIVNNMYHQARKVDINIKGLGDAKIQSIYTKHLYADAQGFPTLDEATVTTPITSINIGSEATMILEYTFDQTLPIPEVCNEKKYYADVYKQPILANTAIPFNINNVDLGTQGEVVLRVGIGRDFGKSLHPTIVFNDSIINVPTNFRGDDQKNRSSFFGVLEIPIPYAYLKSNNTVKVTFPEATGFVSSMTMQVFNFSKPILRTPKPLEGIVVNPAIKQSKTGVTFALKANAMPAENQAELKIKWSSSDTAVAVVDSLGNVTTKKTGTINIVATDTVSMIQGVCKLIVTNDVPSVYFDNRDKYMTNTYYVGGNLEVSCTYEAGYGNTVTGTRGGIKYFFRQITTGWKVVKDIVVYDAAAIGTKAGTSTVTIPLTGVTPSADLPVGDFYFIFIQFESSNGTTYNVGVNPINVLPANVGVKQNRALHAMVYPNPASSVLYVNVGNAVVGDVVQLLSPSGSLVAGKTYRLSGEPVKFDLNHLSKGLYLVRILGKQPVTMRFTKQ